MKYLIGLLLISVFYLASAQNETLDAPVSNDESICGAGYVTFTATSSINDNDLEFEWYESSDGQLQFLGSLDGSIGRTQFITSFLISDKQFAVRVKLGNQVSPYTFVRAEVLNEATVLQQPAIQLCGEAYLEVETNMDSIESYQWQILVPDEFGQSFFQNLSTVSSNSVILTAIETGFYRAVVTDSTGCKAISSEVEVTNRQVVEFINSTVSCYDPSDPDSDRVTLTSDYGRSFTTYQWEESLDSINFSFVANTQSITVSKPRSQPFDTAFYRLTITEQNCSNDTIIGVYWRPLPEGSINHDNPLIGGDDFFFCDEDATGQRTLNLTTSSPNVVATWYTLNYSQLVTLDAIKSISGVSFPDFFPQFQALGVQGRELGTGNSIELQQENGTPFEVDGGLIYVELTDTVSNCSTITNGIFADSAFPFPIYGNRLAYNYPDGGNHIPACANDELTFISYDQSADAYAWLEYDAATDTYTEVDNDASFRITIDEGFSSKTYFLEVTKNGCTGLSEGFNVSTVDPPSVEIVNIDEEAVACNELPGILLVGEGSSDIISYQWYYSPDDVNYVFAPVDSAKHFYFATLSGYYKLEVSNKFCLSETESVRVEIPDTSAPDFVEVALEGDGDYCEGDELVITCNYSGPEVGYFWYYSFFELNGDDLSIELVELGGTSSPEITLDTRVFGEGLLEPMVVYFYILVIDGSCIYGSTNTPFVATINPSPNIEILFSDAPTLSERFFCGNETINAQVEVNNLAAVDIPDLDYIWTRYNPANDEYETIPGAIETSYTITEAGRYRSIASTSDNSCASISNDLDILTLPLRISGDNLYCEGNTISMRAEQGFIPDLSIIDYQWFYSTNGNEFDDLAGESSFELSIDPESDIYGPGSFYFQASYDGCVATSDTLSISENNNSFGSSFSVGASQVKGIPFEASVSLEIDLAGVTFNWEPAEFVSFSNGSSAVFTFPESHGPESSQIQLTISSPNGCEVFYEQLVVFEENTTLTFSKFITPNGDGLNDTFVINGLNTDQSNELIILDSWGNQLFEHSNYYNGTQESASLVNKLKSEGVYYYIFSTETQVMKGSFYLKD